MGIRTTIQRKIIDPIQFRFDIFPYFPYQPLPWLGLKSALRAESTIKRWNAIEKCLKTETVDSAMDIGCNVGFFCFSLAEKGIPTLGVEADERVLRIARYAARKINTSAVSFLNMHVSPENVRLLPSVDVVTVMSVWHHWCGSYGFEEATKLLGTIWSKSQKLMFFESGQRDIMGADGLPKYGLPKMEPSPKEWFTRYLDKTCIGGRVYHVGDFPAFSSSGNGQEPDTIRTLFRLSREK